MSYLYLLSSNPLVHSPQSSQQYAFKRCKLDNVILYLKSFRAFPLHGEYSSLITASLPSETSPGHSVISFSPSSLRFFWCVILLICPFTCLLSASPNKIISNSRAGMGITCPWPQGFTWGMECNKVTKEDL